MPSENQNQQTQVKKRIAELKITLKSLETAENQGEVEVNYDLVIDAPDGASIKAQKSIKKEIKLSTSLSSLLGEVFNSLREELAFYEKQAKEHGLPIFTKSEFTEPAA